MSDTEIELFGSKKKVSKAYAELVGKLEGDKNLTGGSFSSGKKLSIRGSVFRRVINGEEVGVIEDRSLNAVIVKSAPIARFYYDKQYKEGVESHPKCWSSDCKNPAAEVVEADRQSNNCFDCPQNIKGSGQGDNTRACRFSQRLAIMLEGGIEAKEVYQLTVPATSIFGSAKEGGTKMPLQVYARYLDTHKTPPAAIITQFKFDAESSTPKLTFKPIRPLIEEELNVVAEMQQHPDTLQAVDVVVHVSEHPPALPDMSEEDSDEEEVEVAKEPKKKKKDKKKKKGKKAKAAEAVEEVEEEPKVAKKKKQKEEPEEKADLAGLLDEWDDEA